MPREIFYGSSSTSLRSPQAVTGLSPELPCSRTSNVPKRMAQYPKTESIGSTGSIILGILVKSRLLAATRLLRQERLARVEKGAWDAVGSSLAQGQKAKAGVDSQTHQEFKRGCAYIYIYTHVSNLHTYIVHTYIHIFIHVYIYIYLSLSLSLYLSPAVSVPSCGRTFRSRSR